MKEIVIKRVLSLFLAFLMVFSVVPLTSYAYTSGSGGSPVNGGGNSSIGGNGGGGNSSTAGGGGGKGVITVSNDKQGYRFTFVNTLTGEKVGNTVDILRSAPVGVPNAYWFTGSAVENPNKINDDNYKSLLYSQVESYLVDKVVSDSPDIKWWFEKNGDVYGGSAKPFKDWLLSSQAISNLMGIVNTIDKVEDALDKKEAGAESTIPREEFDILIRNLLRDYKRDYSTRGDDIEKYVIWNNISSTLDTGLFLYYNDDGANGFADDYLMQEVMSCQPCTYEDLVKQYGVNFAEIYNNYSDKLFNGNGFTIDEENYKEWFLDDEFEKPFLSLNYLKDLFVFTSYAAPLIDVPIKIGTNIAENIYDNIMKDGKIDVKKYGYITALMMLGSDDTGSSPSIFSGDVSARVFVESFLNNEISLIVEPVIWFKPQSYAGENFPYNIYGTTRNWIYCGNSKLDGWNGWSDYGMNTMRTTNVCLMDNMALEADEGSLESGFAQSQGRLPLVFNKTNTTYLQGDNQKTLIGKTYRIPFSRASVLTNQGVGIGMHIYGLQAGEKPFLTDSPYKTPGIRREKGGDITVVKMYRVFSFSGDKLIAIPYSYHQANQVSRNINIVDESDKGWKLVEWYTTPTESTIVNGGRPLDYEWNKVKQQNKKGTYEGKEVSQITIKEEDPDKVLYILLELRPTIEEEGTKNVIKVYENEKGETEKVTEPEVITGNIYEVPVEEDYIYTESKKSDNPSKTITGWSDTEGSPSTDSKITIDDSTETIYILYQKNTNKQITLCSNELSYTYGLLDLLENRVLFSIYDTVPAAPTSRPSCGGHGDDDWHHSKGSPSIVDGSWSISVKNQADYSSSTFIRDYVDKGRLSITGHLGSSQTGGKNISKDSSETVKPDGDFLLYRDKELDLVTLYPKKNDSLSSSLSSIGLEIANSSFTPHGNRITSELINDKQFLRDFKVNFDYTSHDMGLSWKWIRSSSYGEVTSGSFSTNIVTSPTDANNYYNKSNNVKEYYLLGQRNTGSEEVSDARSDSFGTKYSYNKAYSSTSSDLKFYPYHLMLYRAKNANNSPQNVYVTSENLSTMKVYNAVQLGVYKKNPINALLSSTQWSTHARSLAFSGNTDKKSVIPGGGILDISMGSKGDTELGIRLWQSCLRDEQVETVQQDGFTTSLSKAKEIASNYQSEVKDVIEGYGLVQWGTEGVQTDLNGVLGSGVELHNNTSLDWDGRSYKTSNDSKYYLKHDSSGSDRANFDVLENKITKQVFYEISSDVDGNVILKKDNTEIARASLTQDKSAILSNTEAKLLDDNTKLVSNYFASIDRGLGDRDKYDRTNSRKYNEAYDGVGVLMTELSFSVGFSDNSGHRTTVLDTLLTSSSSSKSDLYNFSDEKVRSFVFATTENSTGSVEAESEGYIGTLSGDSTMNDLYTVLSDIQSFVHSKNFYTSNFNVTDLN